MSDREMLKSALASTPECLSLQQLETVATGKAQANAHMLQCPRCQSELAMLKAFESETPLPGEGAAVAWIGSQLERRLEQIKNPSGIGDLRARSASMSASWLTRWFGPGKMRLGVLVAACALVAVTSVMLLRRSREPKLQASLGPQASVYRSQEVQLVGPIDDVAQVPKTLVWQAFQGAESYKVTMMEVDRTPLWSSELRDTSVTIPEKVRAKIVSSKPILWQVTAVGANGNTLAVSSTQRFMYREHAGSRDPLLPQ